MQISRNTANGPKSNNQISEGISVIIISPLSADLSCTTHVDFVLRDRSLHPKQSPLFCLLRLICASADRIGYISNFCSMIDLLHGLKNSSC